VITVVWAREPLPAGPTVFLAGPSANAGSGVESWRPAAVDELRAQSTSPLTVLTPESRGGVRADRYEDQVDWEHEALESATVILFWIPRCLKYLPGFTTNIEWGKYCRSGRVVLGCPPEAPDARRNRYLLHDAGRYGVPVATTLKATVDAALSLLADVVIRPGHARH
jgi:hypothetical protein